MSDARFWLALVCATVTALLPDVVATALQRQLAPHDHQILQVSSRDHEWSSLDIIIWLTPGAMGYVDRSRDMHNAPE